MSKTKFIEEYRLEEYRLKEYRFGKTIQVFKKLTKLKSPLYILKKGRDA